MPKQGYRQTIEHGNDLHENKRILSRDVHNKLHAQAGRRGIVFIHSAVKKGIVTDAFYKKYLQYVNQEVKETVDE